MKKFLIPLLIISIIFIGMKTMLANSWVEIKIPNAMCGDGNDYKIFYQKGDPTKISLELMGGGVCWSDQTCWGPGLRTWIHPIPKMPSYSYLSSNSSPINEFTKIYFPYCTGDVWAGKHTANYSNQGPTHHHGQLNFKKAIEHLEKQNMIDFKEVKSFLLHGSSAGAIGALMNIKEIDRRINPESKKLLIADSPGLHWNKSFWTIFGPDQLLDMQSLLTDSGLPIDIDTGIMAKELNTYCHKFSHWNFSFIQSTEDIVMARLFGNMSYQEHRNNVLGPYGIKETLKQSSNCSGVITEGKGHAYLILKKYSELAKDMDSNESIKDYVDRSIKENL